MKPKQNYLKEESNQVGLRLDGDYGQRWKTVVEKLGIAPAHIARLSLKAIIEAVEKRDYHLKLPLKFSGDFQDQEQNSNHYKNEPRSNNTH